MNRKKSRFSMSDRPLSMNLLLKNFKKLLNFEAQSIASIKEEIRPVKDNLEFIRSIFENVEQEL